jgi:hypothetical protein
LPQGNECCVSATLIEHLTLKAGSPCLRRYLATPLDEIILSISVAELSGLSPFESIKISPVGPGAIGRA